MGGAVQNRLRMYIPLAGMTLIQHPSPAAWILYTLLIKIVVHCLGGPTVVFGNHGNRDSMSALKYCVTIPGLCFPLAEQRGLRLVLDAQILNPLVPLRKDILRDFP